MAIPKPKFEVNILQYPPDSESAPKSEENQAMDKVFKALKGTAVTKVRNVREGATFQLRGHLARVDLTQCDVLVSSNRNHPTIRPEAVGILRQKQIVIPDARYPQALCTTQDWAAFNRLILAINANCYHIVGSDVHKLNELAQLMLELGVANAINLDGSGSSSFIYLPPGQPAHAIVNNYHDAHEAEAYFHSGTANEIEMYHLEEFLKPRVAGNHLGFR